MAAAEYIHFSALQYASDQVGKLLMQPPVIDASLHLGAKAARSMMRHGSTGALLFTEHNHASRSRGASPMSRQLSGWQLNSRIWWR